MTYSLPLVVSVLFLLACINFLCFIELHFYKLYLRNAAEHLGEVVKLHAGAAKDPLMDIVGILESNWRNVRNIL
jgi:hypothetical protein